MHYIRNKQINFRKKLPKKRIDKNIADIKTEDLIDYFSKNDTFQEQILVASPTLFFKVNHYIETYNISNKDYRNIGSSLFNYYLRSITRHTPFGLFSGVGVINKQSIPISYQKSIRVSYKWLLSIIKNIEKEHPNNLKFYVNNLITYKDYYLSIENHFSDENDLYTDYNQPFEYIRSYNNKFTFNEIFKYLQKYFVEVDEEIIHKYLEELIEKELIISELRPSLSITNKLSNVATKLSSIENYSDLAKQLKYLNKLFFEYQKTDIGNGISIYLQILSEMKKIFKTGSQDIIVNLIYSDNLYQHLKIKEESIDELVNLLAYISNKYNVQDYYVEKFIEKFGVDSEVPISVVVDGNLGIGLPKEGDVKAEIINDGIQQEINYKFWKSLYKNKTFSLDKLNITLPIDIENPYITESFELCIEHYHQKNKVKRYISPIKGSNNTDNMIGRFTLDNKKLLTDLNPTRKYENALLCNINVIPKKISLTNVIESMFLGNSTLSINTSSGEKSTEIKLDNILVGYENNNLYFKDKNTQKNIIFRDKNMLNEQLKNPLIDLLLRYSHPRFSTIHNYPWSYMDNQMVFYPEIKYKDIVVEPQRIRIYKDLLNLTSFKSFKKNINTLLEDVECNETLYFIMADNKIPYINSDLSLNSLYKAIKKSKLEYAEFIDLPDHQECDESYELIYNFSFDKDDRKIINNNNKKLWTHNNNRLMDPSQGWLYFKILFAKNEIDYFIKHYYHLIEKEILKTTKKFKIFYIKYTENDSYSLRFRIKLSSPNAYSNVITDITKFFKQLKSEGKIKAFSLQDYEREIERYGGVEGVTYCEEVFYEDTKLTNYIIINTSEKYRLAYCCLSIYNYLNFYFESHVEIMKYLMKNFNVKKKDFPKYNTYFRENKMVLDKLFINKDIEEDIDILLKNRIQKLLKLKDKEILNCEMLDSLIHMSCNRILGIDRDKENGCIYLVYKLLDSLEKRRRKNNIT
ncbi:hypothetical protein GC135_12200 (plasmid) [Staphylococcus capitis]|uniref:NsjB lantibiotic dehydratase n=1 Tax=Staphylococcus capitis TaxID=29388 RepID=A0A650A8S3_STACP|nr:lantibiotic dehydratase [Staphylococcus capitis]MRN10160.1 hypothetical protein [Staphylococcus capitis]QGN18864.1 nsjB lantibiotic dehydratase [Staphylococcus capitis]